MPEITVQSLIEMLTNKDTDIEALAKALEVAQRENINFGSLLSQKINDFFDQFSESESELKNLVGKFKEAKKIKIQDAMLRKSFLDAAEDDNEDEKNIFREVMKINNAAMYRVELLDEKFNPPPLSGMTMSQLFKNVGLQGNKYPKENVAKEIVSRMDKISPDLNLTHGPLNKSIYTIQMEELVKDILSGKKMDIRKTVNNEVLLAIPDENKIYNITDIIKNCDLSHLQINDNLMQKYVTFLKDKAQYKKYKPDIYIKDIEEFKFPTEQDFKARDPKGKYDNLSYAEKLAINIYSGAAYTDMNGLLRGKKVIDDSIPALQEIILHTAFCAIGLNKIPIERYEFAMRGEKNLPEAILKQRIECVEKGEITFERGFISTSSAKLGMFEGNVVIIFTGGIQGQDVSALAIKDDEDEILAIPSQLSWIGYTKDKDGCYYFHARAVRTLNGLSFEQQQAPFVEEAQKGTPKEVAEQVEKPQKKIYKRAKPVTTSFAASKASPPSSESVAAPVTDPISSPRKRN